MASAGRILIMPKGTYNAETEYEMLDLVFHNKTSWLAKKGVIGIEPSESNSEHWHKLCDIELPNYLKLSGGTLTGELVLGGGTGILQANEYGAYLQATKDSENYRNLKIDNPDYPDGLGNCARLVEAIGGVTNEYKLFGEHNLPLLKEHLKSSVKITSNPEGKNYIDWTFSVPNSDDICMSANVEFSTDLYVVATNIIDRTETDVTVRFMLSKEYSDFVTLRIEYTL